MSRRKKPESRCKSCQMRQEICLCSEIQNCRNDVKALRQSLGRSSKIFIVMHHRETLLSTNTGRLANLAIPDCETRVRGLIQTPLDTRHFIEEGRKTLLMFPSEDAHELSPEFVKSLNGAQVNLIVPDGSWRQASKVHKRESILHQVPCVKLPMAGESQYHLRREVKEGGLATFEAIARAMGFLEGPQVQERLEHVFKEMVSRTLESRGTLSAYEKMQAFRDTQSKDSAPDFL